MNNCLLTVGMVWRVRCASKADNCVNIWGFQALLVLVEAV